MKTLPHLAIIGITGLLLFSQSANGATVFYQEDFENGSLGLAIRGVGDLPTNEASATLGGRSLLFGLGGLGDLAVWNLADTDSETYYVRFTVHAQAGSNVSLFFDNPSAIRSDFSLIGTHEIEAFYDLNLRSASVWVDGVADPAAVSGVWRPTLDPTSLRIGNQVAPPGSSLGVFEVDDLFVSDTRPIPEPSGALLLLLGATIGLSTRKRTRRLAGS